MTATPDSQGELRWDEAFDTARAFIRHRYEEDGCVVDIGEVLDHFDDRFGAGAGGGAGIINDVAAVLNLCTGLGADPHIDRVPGRWIEFCWNEAGGWPREDLNGLLVELLGRSDEEEIR